MPVCDSIEPHINNLYTMVVLPIPLTHTSLLADHFSSYKSHVSHLGLDSFFINILDSWSAVIYTVASGRWPVLSPASVNVAARRQMFAKHDCFNNHYYYYQTNLSSEQVKQARELMIKSFIKFVCGGSMVFVSKFYCHIVNDELCKYYLGAITPVGGRSRHNSRVGTI